jgi:hypothetical protein
VTAIPDETLLREKARQAIRAEKLPSRRPDRMWGGSGLGDRCVICGETITRDQMELEIQFARAGAGSDLDGFHVHVWCFAAWELERRQDEAPLHS